MRGMPFFDHAPHRPADLMIMFDEAHMLLTDPASRPEAPWSATEEKADWTARPARSLMLATHIPSLSDLGGCRRCGTCCAAATWSRMRTANRVAPGMLGLEKDPSEIPLVSLTARKPTAWDIGGPDNRPDSPMRVRPGAEARARCPPCPRWTPIR